MEWHGLLHVRWFRLMVDQFDHEPPVVQARLGRGPCDETAWRAGCDLEHSQERDQLAREPQLRGLMGEARTLLPADHPFLPRLGGRGERAVATGRRRCSQRTIHSSPGLAGGARELWLRGADAAPGGPSIPPPA